jgi:hypothetical protein
MRDDKSPDDFMLMLKGLSNYVAQLDSEPHFYVVTLIDTRPLLEQLGGLPAPRLGSPDAIAS